MPTFRHSAAKSRSVCAIAASAGGTGASTAPSRTPVESATTESQRRVMDHLHPGVGRGGSIGVRRALRPQERVEARGDLLGTLPVRTVSRLAIDLDADSRNRRRESVVMRPPEERVALAPDQQCWRGETGKVCGIVIAEQVVEHVAPDTRRRLTTLPDEALEE